MWDGGGVKRSVALLVRWGRCEVQCCVIGRRCVERSVVGLVAKTTVFTVCVLNVRVLRVNCAVRAIKTTRFCGICTKRPCFT